mgnify:CR=1 FL=1
MILEWPQMAYIAITLVGIGVTMEKHGQEETCSFPISFLSSAVCWFLLWKGGFFG